MIEVTTSTRKWGNSLGLRIPKAIVEQANIREDQEVTFLLIPKKNPLKKFFGTVKKRRSTQSIKDEIRRELQ